MPVAALLATPIGELQLVAEGDALTAIALPGRPRVPAPPGDAPVLQAAAAQLAAYFAGTRTAFDLPLAPAGTAFQREVWAALAAIPCGRTTTYGELARALGRPAGASRAVGAANGANPLAIVVPCHRVIGAGGALTGYAGGLALKRWLLAHEARHAGATALPLWRAAAPLLPDGAAG